MNSEAHAQSNLFLPAVILDRPQMGENIGSAARSMLNFGLTGLRIVSPRDGWPNDAAIANAAKAFNIITPQIFDSFEQSIADLTHVYATTARMRDLKCDVYSPQSLANHMRNQKSPWGIAFGCERTGLGNKDIARCHGIVEISCNPDFSSLNLAQAVNVISYQMFTAQFEKGCEKDNAPCDAERDPAPVGQIQSLQSRLEDELEQRGFFRTAEMKPKLLDNIRMLINRTQMDTQEVQMMHGVISALIGNKNTDQD